jgi:hypothetical protein
VANNAKHEGPDCIGAMAKDTLFDAVELGGDYQT